MAIGEDVLFGADRLESFRRGVREHRLRSTIIASVFAAAGVVVHLVVRRRASRSGDWREWLMIPVIFGFGLLFSRYSQERGYPLWLSFALVFIPLFPVFLVIQRSPRVRIGWLVTEGRDEEAIRLAESADARIFDDPNVRLHMVCALFRTGRREEARRWLEPLETGNLAPAHQKLVEHWRHQLAAAEVPEASAVQPKP